MSGVDLVQWLTAQLDADERIARAASGSTVVGERGNWSPAPGGDEWEVARDDGYADELLVALRPDLPRPPETLGGYWGVVVSFRWEDESGSGSPTAELRHAAEHDPARVLREIEAKRKLVALHGPSEFGAWVGDDDDQMPACGVCGDLTTRFPCRTLRLLASVYDDRPGFQEAWRP